MTAVTYCLSVSAFPGQLLGVWFQEFAESLPTLSSEVLHMTECQDKTSAKLKQSKHTK
jgi:hypothetical protein